MWAGTGGEGAKAWMGIVAELRNRGVADVCIVACDGLKGLPDAIAEIWPQATVQLCVVHLVRASLRYASKKYWGQISKDLREVYTAPTQAAAEQRFAEFELSWGGRYPAIIRLWRNAWEQFIPFLAFPPEIRKIIYTTNAIESLNSRFRQACRNRGHFPDEQSALKSARPGHPDTAQEPDQRDRRDAWLEGSHQRADHVLRRQDHPQLMEISAAHEISDSPIARTMGGLFGRVNQLLRSA